MSKCINGLVSIIMPIYNRARFLAQAIDSICGQQYTNWELIIVDDGSSDDSLSLLADLVKDITQPIVILEQTNQGPAAARNAGINAAKGEFVAFFDSDDFWYSFHLQNCVQALQAHPQLSWIYGACERYHFDTKECLQRSTFYTSDAPNKLFSIARKTENGVYLLDSSEAILLQLTTGLDNGLQNSVLRKTVLDKHLIPNFRVGEDRLFIIMALKSGFNMGFIDQIHVRYYVHDANISDTNKDSDNYERRIEALERLMTAKNALVDLVDLNKRELKVYKHQVSKELFWELGYALYQASGDYRRAMSTYAKAIKLKPFTPSYYKTYVVSCIKRIFSFSF
ncbi:glycosyltransferase family 2 protein [Glaciecola siphonariae]|uniref:Glycosyltransferase family 2 protein n=1 Tax=Glaciecola siphonariae TaxID=521012 RepID=A0ABV9LUF7_9ALTE